MKKDVQTHKNSIDLRFYYCWTCRDGILSWQY